MNEHLRPITQRTRILFFVGLVFVGLMAAAAIYLALHSDSETRGKQAAQGQAVQAENEKIDIADEVQKVCNAGGPAAAKLKQQGLCDRTKQIVEQGPQGPQGPGGPVGPTGPAGPQGPIGPQGPQGPVGPRGPQGIAGPTPPCLLVSTKCTGPQGPLGPVGPEGRTGPAGPKGDQGIQGERGIQGEKGDTGDKGDKGDTGDKGDKGDTGVVSASSTCDAEEGKYVASVNLVYDPDTRALTLTCVKAELQPTPPLQGATR